MFGVGRLGARGKALRFWLARILLDDKFEACTTFDEWLHRLGNRIRGPQGLRFMDSSHMFRQGIGSCEGSIAF